MAVGNLRGDKCMAKFSDIVGQEELKQHIRSAIETDKVSHAYIINGERNAGKEFIARLFAMALQCEKGGVEPCGAGYYLCQS